MKRKLIITESQLKTLVEYIKPKVLKEDTQDVLMGAAVLLGAKLSGFNQRVAKDALSSPKTLNLIKKKLESSDIADIVSGLEGMGMKDVMGKLENDRYEIQKRFDDIAFDTEGVKGGLVINVDKD
tara:strand:- start:534 stop:908 length:375 start_codon:yes stop_codon:yes gene_type:complete